MVIFSRSTVSNLSMIHRSAVARRAMSEPRSHACSLDHNSCLVYKPARPGVSERTGMAFGRKGCARNRILEGARCCQRISLLFKTGKVARSTITEIERELKSRGRRRAPTEIGQSSDSHSGPGALVLDDFAIFVILMRYHEEPRRTWEGYTIGLSDNTGTLVSTSTISIFFHDGVEIKVSLCTPKLRPYDKCRPEN